MWGMRSSICSYTCHSFSPNFISWCPLSTFSVHLLPVEEKWEVEMTIGTSLMIEDFSLILLDMLLDTILHLMVLILLLQDIPLKDIPLKATHRPHILLMPEILLMADTRQRDILPPVDIHQHHILPPVDILPKVVIRRHHILPQVDTHLQDILVHLLHIIQVFSIHFVVLRLQFDIVCLFFGR